MSLNDLPGAAPGSRLRKRLWLGGGGLALFLLTLVIGNAVIPQERAVGSRMLGHDFLAFYTAGTFAREGRSHDLYNLEAVKTFERDLMARENLEVGDSF